jgi:hypothetical protein
MQGKLIIAIAGLSVWTAPAIAVEQPRRPSCTKAEAQRQQQAKQAPQRVRSQLCRLNRTVPPVVDPTPMFLL